MDDRKIFECVAKKQPGVRAVQISDMLNVDLKEVSDALRILVESGELVRSSGFAPNGAPAQLYDFSPSFKASNDYKAVMAAVAPQVGATAVPAPTPAPTQPAATGDAPSRAERAIALILRTGGATDDEVRAELVMKPTEYPSGILGHAVKTGRVTRLNNRWVPGDGRAVLTPPAKPFNSEPLVPSFLAGAQKPAPRANSGGLGKTRKSEPAAEPVVEVVAPSIAPAAPAPQPFRIGIWSDGTIETQRNGATVGEYSIAESDQIAKFIGLMPTWPVAQSDS